LDAGLCAFLHRQPLDSVIRKYGVSLHDLTKWRDKVLSSAKESLLKTNEIDEAIEVEKKTLLFQDRRNYHGQQASCREISVEKSGNWRVLCL
jgi:hypothetical protein